MSPSQRWISAGGLLVFILVLSDLVFPELSPMLRWLLYPENMKNKSVQSPCKL